MRSAESRCERGFPYALQTPGLGALVLLAFLSFMPFGSRFPGFGDVQHAMYAAGLVLAATAAVMLLAPAACHHWVSRGRVPQPGIRTVNLIAAGGLASAALGWSAAVRIAARWAGSALEANLVGASTAVLFAVAWFVLPALLSRDRSPDGPPG
jgi:Family of unknown function (DUF6328)